VLAAGVTGALIGAVGGAALAGSIEGSNWWWGALFGAVALGFASGWADATRTPGEMQPLVLRVLSAAMLAAAAGGFLEWVLPDWSAVIPSALTGVAVGAIGFRIEKVLLGLGIGVVVGLTFDSVWPTVGWAVPTALTVVIYRLVAVVVWRGRDQVRIVGERVSPEQERFVVGFSEATKYVGVDYLERYAGEVGAAFAHSPPDIGIVADFDALSSSVFEAGRVDPLIREFYEHTSRFRLAITPEWRWWMRPPYRLFRATIARPIGQANAPFDQEEVQDGVVSWIDTIDMDGDGTVDFRAWVRAYETGEPLYIGIYTIHRIEGLSYVSVGFPLPSGNFTATLLPSNHRDTGLLLSSDSDAPFSGHYISAVEDDDALTTLQLVTFGEQIDVFVEHGQLKTEHRFYLDGTVFMTLHYDIERK
jgi:hypothetical protein